MFVLLFVLEARNHRRGKVGRVIAGQTGEGLVGIAGAKAAQMENWQRASRSWCAAANFDTKRMRSSEAARSRACAISRRAAGSQNFGDGADRAAFVESRQFYS